MYYEFLQHNKRRIIVLVVAFLVITTIWTIMLFVGRAGKLPVVIAVVPSSASVTADGRHVDGGTQWLPPGTYTIRASKDGFETVQKSITVTNDKSQNVVALSLTATSDAAKKWAADHQNDYSNNEQYGAIAANIEGEYFSKQNPITTKLPFTDPYFTIGYTVNSDGKSITLTVATPSPRYRFYAVEKIRELGFDPTDFTIVFKDFHNPLGQQ